MARPKTITLTPTAADADGIATSQTPGGAGNLTIDGAFASGGVATFTVPAPVTITAVGNDSARTFTVTGTDRNGHAMTEAIAGPNATTTAGTKMFKTITQIAVDAATAGAVTAGNGLLAATQWIVWDWRRSDSAQIQVVQTGTGTWSVQHTNDNIQEAGTNEADYTAIADASVAGKTASFLAQFEFVPRASRLIYTAYTSGGLTAYALEA